MGAVRQTANSSEFLTHIGICYRSFHDLYCLKRVLMKATCEREIFKLFQVTKCKGCYSLKLEKNTKRKILKLNILYLVEKIVRFHVDCRPQIRIVYSKVSVQSVRPLDRDQLAVGCLFW